MTLSALLESDEGRIIMNMDELECMRPDTNNGDRSEICAGDK